MLLPMRLPMRLPNRCNRSRMIRWNCPLQGESSRECEEWSDVQALLRGAARRSGVIVRREATFRRHCEARSGEAISCLTSIPRLVRQGIAPSDQARGPLRASP
jgi:hypothetical protein